MRFAPPSRSNPASPPRAPAHLRIGGSGFGSASMSAMSSAYRAMFMGTVNIAARLETLAEPDGICISRGVRDTVRGKFSVEFENRGELAVKNIPDPVGAFNVVFDPIAWTMGRNATKPDARSGWVRYAIAAGVVLVTVAAVGCGAWYVATSRDRPVTATPGSRPVPSGTAPAASAGVAAS